MRDIAENKIIDATKSLEEYMEKLANLNKLVDNERVADAFARLYGRYGTIENPIYKRYEVYLFTQDKNIIKELNKHLKDVSYITNNTSIGELNTYSDSDSIKCEIDGIKFYNMNYKIRGKQVDVLKHYYEVTCQLLKDFEMNDIVLVYRSILGDNKNKELAVEEFTTNKSYGNLILDYVKSIIQ